MSARKFKEKKPLCVQAEAEELQRFNEAIAKYNLSAPIPLYMNDAFRIAIREWAERQLV